MLKKNAPVAARLNKNSVKYFRKSVLNWSHLNRYEYPWRDTKNRFHALIAEMMLQRTKAEQVVPVYKNFARQFPSPGALNSAPVKEIKKLISSLGLGWRATYIKDLGYTLQRKYKNRIPDDFQKLIYLPGVGPYIASAFVSFHCGRRATIIDSNIVRLYGRFLGFKTNPETRRDKKLATITEKFTPFKNVKKFNYAVLDLSRKVCATIPKCLICPISCRCFYNRKGAMHAKAIRNI